MNLREQLEWNPFYWLEEKKVKNSAWKEFTNILVCSKNGTLANTCRSEEPTIFTLLHEIEWLKRQIDKYKTTVEMYKNEQKQIKDLLLPGWDTIDNY